MSINDQAPRARTLPITKENDRLSLRETGFSLRQLGGSLLVSYLRSALRRAAQRAFIKSESLFRPAALKRRRDALGAVLFVVPRRALSLAHRARAAAAIFARAAAERGRRAPPPPPLGLAPPPRPPNKLLSRRSSAVICLRIDNACSKADSDKSIAFRNRVELSFWQDLLMIYSLAFHWPSGT
jgi:hypothetical protein